MERIAILGSGMAGFGAAHRLNSEGVASVLYEKQTYHGGNTASLKYEEGFIFDVGPHISFTKDERIQKLFAESVNHEEVSELVLDKQWLQSRTMVVDVNY